MKRHPNLSDSLRLSRSRFLRRATRLALGLSVAGARLSVGHRSQFHDRRGSTLLVVMALLGMLTLLGLLYFTFATQELQNATNFAEAAKKNPESGDDIDAIFNESLRQLILGADYGQKGSVLWGGRHSLLGTLIGQRTSNGQWERQPYTGQGISQSTFVTPNDSPAANDLQERNLAGMPGADIGHTYPDFNNMLLAYQANTWDLNATAPTRFPIPLVKPSFHRPELLRNFTGAIPVPLENWAVATTTSAPNSTKGLLFRPHPEHLYVWRQNTSATPQRRFIIDTTSNPFGDLTLAGFVAADAGLIGGGPGQVSTGFPFIKDQDGDGNFSEQGAWSAYVGVDGKPGVAGFDDDGDGKTDNSSELGAGGSDDTLANKINAYDYDVDTDDDSIPDAIWMDLDHQVLTRASDGKTYVPLIAFKVMDADGLLNLNVVGNLSGNTRTAATTNFGNGNDISRSSQGISPSEINPIWGLDAVPGVDFTLPTVPNNYYVQYFNHNPNPANVFETGNMEWWWLNKGRIDYLAPNVIHAGRLGEANRLWQVLSAGPNAISVHQTNSNLFPFPGVWDQDDNRDINEGGPIVVAGLAAGQSSPFSHPLALNGLGRHWTNSKQLDLLQAVGGNPSQWLRYTNTGVGDNGSGVANVKWANPFAGVLMVNPIVGATFAYPGSPATLVDDMNELTIEPKYDPRPYDEPLDPKETLPLFMSEADRTSTRITSRVRDLMPGNIDIGAAGASQYLIKEVGKRFTTSSWDLKQFALNSNPGADGLPSTSDDGPRGWEWNVDSDGNGKLEFPPQFSPPADYRPALPQHAYGYSHNGTSSIKQDPFRPQLRRLLETEFGNTSNAKLPMRLSINEFLDVEHIPGAALPAPYSAANPTAYANYFRDRPLAYRPLTPHSTDTAAADPAWGSPPALPTPFALANVANPLPSYPPRNEPEKEFWARRDRQQMARDIYVMLYTFCGDDNFNVTTTPGNTAYPTTSRDSRRQMAQFAVNLVDSLDRDNVITAFEYDRDLSNGWDLDDDVTTVDGGGDYAIVFGVESQELTISEAVWLRQEMYGMDNTQTPFNEMTGEANFLHFELRSTSAFDVPLAQSVSTAANKGVWRVWRDDDGDGIYNAAIDNRVELLAGVGGAVVAPGDKLPPGSLFTIASAESATGGSAALYIDSSNTAADFELVSPNKGGLLPFSGGMIASADVAPDLDLLHSSHAGRFALTSAGNFFSLPSKPAGNTITLALQRRLNPDLPQLTISANPYVTVDEFRNVTRRELKFQGDSMVVPALPAVASQADATNRLSYLTPFDSPAYPVASQERRQPLNANAVAACAAVVGPSPHRNTLSQTNQNVPTGGLFNLFQPHFDRDFASTVDLFHIYLNGPAGLTSSVVPSRQSPFTTTNPATFGQAVIHNMEDRDYDGALTPAEDINSNMTNDPINHFHRLLSMVDVPTRTHLQLGDPLKINRVPGRINLNTVRDPRVLGALLDDRQVMGTPEHTGADFNGNTTIEEGLLDLTGDTARDWWFEFVRSRDGIDPTSNLLLPGVVGVSRPFRDAGTLQSTVSGQSPTEDTVFRRLPAPTDSVGRRLFELVREDNSEFQNGAIDPVMKHRLLSKIYGNSTTRSNVFVVFVTIGMFECIETTPAGATEPVVRIGGPLNQPLPAPPGTHTQYRAVFILDRSDAEQAFDAGGTSFDWQKLIKARQRIN